MKKKLFYAVTVIVIMLSSACGSAAEPTPSIVEIQGTAVALAQTSIAITKAALPANTPIPTLVPTLAETVTPFPTLAPAIPPTSVVAAIPTNTQTNPCNEPPPTDPKGTTVQVKFVNKTKGLANLSFGMLEENEFDECGTYSFTIGAKTTPEVTVMAGCYWAYAWITGNTPSVARSTYSICLTDPNQVRGVTINPETIGFD